MTTFVARHAPDPANMEAYWMWHCTCGDASDREFATREDAEDAAAEHHCVIDISPGAFIEIVE